jgi:hypothetical protein
VVRRGRSRPIASNVGPTSRCFLDDGRIRLTYPNNAADRALRSVGIGRANSTFEIRTRGATPPPVYTLIQTCVLKDVDPQAWLLYVPAKPPRPSG